MKKVTVIGHFAFGLEYLDGQTVKTKIIADQLSQILGNEQVKKVDTHGAIRSLLKAPLQTCAAMRSCKNLIMLPAQNGLRIYAPLLSFGKHFFRNTKLHYVVIGGWLPKYLKRHTFVRKCLKNYIGIYVETNTMKRALEQQGFTNVFVLPNCKNLTILDRSDLVYHTQEPYRLCTFSRVMKEKGIEDAVEAIKAVNEHFGRVVYTLDIFGPIDFNQTNWFDQIKEGFPEYIKYCGTVPSDRSVDAIKEYFALLFPTRFYTEGVPGTIIDAYAAGVPVISSKWESFENVMEDGVTGIGYGFDDPNGLISVLKSVAEDPSRIQNMKISCLEKAKTFMPGAVINTLMRNMR